MATIEKFINTLKEIKNNDTNYEKRYPLVFKALSQALELGYKAGIRVDPSEPNWPVVQIELLDYGQISWHMPSHEVAYDGHSTEDKYNIIDKFCNDETSGGVFIDKNKSGSSYSYENGKYKLTIWTYHHNNRFYTKGIVYKNDLIVANIKRNNENFLHQFISTNNEEWLLCIKNDNTFVRINLDTGYEYSSLFSNGFILTDFFAFSEEIKTIIVIGHYPYSGEEIKFYDFNPLNNSFGELKIQLDPPVRTPYKTITNNISFKEITDCINVNFYREKNIHIEITSPYSTICDQFYEKLSDFDKECHHEEDLDNDDEIIDKNILDIDLYREGDTIKLTENNLLHEQYIYEVKECLSQFEKLKNSNNEFKEDEYIAIDHQGILTKDLNQDYVRDFVYIDFKDQKFPYVMAQYKDGKLIQINNGPNII